MKLAVRVTWDKRDDLGYIYFKEIQPGSVAHTFPCPPDDVCGHTINLDFDTEGRLVGIELIRASKVLPAEFLSAPQN